jgi:hypothetical protein
MQFPDDMKKASDNPEAANIIRHAILMGIKSYKKKFSKYGEIIICCDGGNYWRKDLFPYYKGKRKSNRESSEFDWDFIFSTMMEIREDLKKYFPYKVLCVEGAEADDIIAVLCKYTQSHDLIEEGLVEVRQPVMIISADHDFKQLQKWDNVHQWSPMQKKLVKSADPSRDLIEKILVGDAGDGVPGICSPDHVFMTEGMRQTPFRKARIDDFIKHGRNACKNDNERHGWNRNIKMIDFENIPDDISNKIVSQYASYIVSGDRMTIFNYLVSKRCRKLIEEIELF